MKKNELATQSIQTLHIVLILQQTIMISSGPQSQKWMGKPHNNALK